MTSNFNPEAPDADDDPGTVQYRQQTALPAQGGPWGPSGFRAMVGVRPVDGVTPADSAQWYLADIARYAHLHLKGNKTLVFGWVQSADGRPVAGDVDTNRETLYLQMHGGKGGNPRSFPANHKALRYPVFWRHTTNDGEDLELVRLAAMDLENSYKLVWLPQLVSPKQASELDANQRSMVLEFTDRYFREAPKEIPLQTAREAIRVYINTNAQKQPRPPRYDGPPSLECFQPTPEELHNPAPAEAWFLAPARQAVMHHLSKGPGAVAGLLEAAGDPSRVPDEDDSPLLVPEDTACGDPHISPPPSPFPPVPSPPPSPPPSTGDSSTGFIPPLLTTPVHSWSPKWYQWIPLDEYYPYM